MYWLVCFVGFVMGGCLVMLLSECLCDCCFDVVFCCV